MTHVQYPDSFFEHNTALRSVLAAIRRIVTRTVDLSRPLPLGDVSGRVGGRCTGRVWREGLLLGSFVGSAVEGFFWFLVFGVFFWQCVG